MQDFILKNLSKNFAWILAFQNALAKSFKSDACNDDGGAGEAVPDALDAGSTVPRRQLGRYLRDLRNAAGLTVRDAARGLEWSEAKMWRIETGQTSLRSLDVEAMCRLYDAPREATRDLMALAKETKARGWWQAFSDAMPDSFHLYVGLEAAASRILQYHGDLVPGLFQSEDYARTVIRTHNPHLDESEVARRLGLRMARQAILRRPIDPPVFQVAIDAAVLLRPVGGPDVMAAQLDRLAEISELPNVALRVVPFSAGLHPGLLAGSFVLMRFPVKLSGEESEPPTVYAELFTGSVYLDKADEIKRYERAFGGIWELATDEFSSRELIRQTGERLKDG